MTEKLKQKSQTERIHQEMITCRKLPGPWWLTSLQMVYFKSKIKTTTGEVIHYKLHVATVQNYSRSQLSDYSFYLA